jgi:hypothetical protein
MFDTTTDPPVPPGPAASFDDLEERVRKLERAVAELPAPADDEVIVNRVLARLSALAEGRSMSGTDLDRVVVLDPPRSSPLAPVAPPPDGAVPQTPGPPPDPTRKKWVLTQFFAEVRTMFRMYFDPRYRISRTTQFLLPLIAGLVVFNFFFFSVWVDILFVSPVVERVLLVILAILGYKVLTRELARYREVLDYLARTAPR